MSGSRGALFRGRKTATQKRPFFLLLFLWASKEKVNLKNKSNPKKKLFNKTWLS
jgi:hypothetical protein